MTRRLLLLALLALIVPPLTGCATMANLPTAQFHGMRIQMVQPDPGSDDLSLQVGFEFKVDNPLGIKLTVPEHSFGLEIDGAPAASTGVRREFDVGAKTFRIVTYDFTLALGPEGLGAAMGKEAEFAFTAEADIDVPAKVIQILQDNLPDVSGTAGDLGIGAEGLSAGLSGLSTSGSDSTKAKLRFGKTGQVRLPKVPRVEPPPAGVRPQVQLVGSSETMSLGNLLGDLEEAGQPIVQLLEILQGAAVEQEIRLPVGDLLEEIGVPRELTGAALTTLNTFMMAQGEGSLPSRNSTIAIPVDLPPLSELLQTVDPQASAKIAAFEDSWEDFTSGTLGLDSGLAIPTALPSGMRVAAPFQINNVNEFPIQTPSFRLAIVDAAGNPVAVVGALPAAQAGGASNDLTVPAYRTVEVAGQADQAMELVTEIHWDALTGGLLQAAMSGGGSPPPQLDGMRLVGEVTVDPGYGPITVPLSVPLQPAETGGAPAGGSGSKSGGSNSKSGSGSKDSGSKSSGTKSSSGSKDSGSKSSKDSGSKSSKDSGSKSSSGSKSKESGKKKTKK